SSSGAMTRRRRDWTPWVVGAVTGIVLVLFLVYPIGKTLLSSFVAQGDSLSLENLTLRNFQRFFTSSLYKQAFVNSLVVSLASTVIATLLALPAAYAMARIEIPFRNLIMSLSVIPLIAPPFIGAYSWVILLGRQGIFTHYLNDWFGITLPSIFGPFGIILALSLAYFPFVFLITQGALAAADPYIEESASLMGASRWRILRTVTFPLVLPSILAGSLTVFIRALGNVGVPGVLGGDYYVLPTLILFQVEGFFNLNGAAAIAVVNVLLVLVVLLVIQRFSGQKRFVTMTGTTRAARRSTSLRARLFGTIYTWGLLLLALLPQMVVLFSSFAERWTGTLFPVEYGFGNYRLILQDVLAPITNSLTLATAATVLALLFGTITAYVALRKRFRGRWVIDLTIMLPFVLPGIVTGVAYLATFNSGWLVLTGTGIILVFGYFVRRIAYAFRSVSAAIGQVDPKLEEASAICGAGWGHTMRKVTVPLIAPGILAGGILVFSTLIGELSVTIMLFSGKWKTVSIAIYEYLTSHRIAPASALGSVVVVITLTLVFVASRLTRRGMADMFR
ncbi:MAG: iron ABC transporter permease, partial [Trueperaceae bacterium]